MHNLPCKTESCLEVDNNKLFSATLQQHIVYILDRVEFTVVHVLGIGISQTRTNVVASETSTTVCLISIWKFCKSILIPVENLQHLCTLLCCYYWIAKVCPWKCHFHHWRQQHQSSGIVTRTLKRSVPTFGPVLPWQIY